MSSVVKNTGFAVNRRKAEVLAPPCSNRVDVDKNYKFAKNPFLFWVVVSDNQPMSEKFNLVPGWNMLLVKLEES